MNKQTKITTSDLKKMNLVELLKTFNASRSPAVREQIDLMAMKSNGYGWKRVAQIQMEDETNG